MDSITVGRIVHFVLMNGEHRPAIVVNAWPNLEAANITVFADGPNDATKFPLTAQASTPGNAPPLYWVPSVTHDEDEKHAGTWHWPERNDS